MVAVARNASYSQYWNASGKKKEKTLCSQCQSMLPGFLSTFHKYIIACARQSFLSQKLKENLHHIWYVIASRGASDHKRTPRLRSLLYKFRRKEEDRPIRITRSRKLPFPLASSPDTGLGCSSTDKNPSPIPRRKYQDHRIISLPCFLFLGQRNTGLTLQNHQHHPEQVLPGGGETLLSLSLCLSLSRNPRRLVHE